MGNILTAGGFVPTTTDTPLDARTRVATFAKIADIENPYKLMRITVEDTGKTYEVRKLTSKVIGGITVENAAIDIDDPNALFDLGKGEEERSEAETIRQENEVKRISAEDKRSLAESNRQGAESDREKAEIARAKSESSRQLAETNRQSAETARSNKESERINNESARVSAENKRKSNEETRVSNENARKTSESQRQTEENKRASNESNRIEAENVRVSEENKRIVAEGKRDTAEKARVNSETTRNNNEELRKTAELERVTAEQGRVEAELKRGTDFDTLKSEMQTTIDEGKEATKDTIAATEGLDAIVEEQNAKLTELGSYVENPEYARAYTDAEGRFLWGIRQDGSVEFTKGVPSSIKAYIDSLDRKNDEEVERINQLVIGLLADVKVLTDTYHYISNPEWACAIVDSEERILMGIKADGSYYIPNREMYHVESNPEYAKAVVDSEGRVLFGIKVDGSCYIPKGISEEAKKGLLELTTRISWFETDENPEWLQVTTDSEGRVLEGIGIDGKKYLPKQEMLEKYDDPEGRSEITLDADGKILSYRDAKGIKHENKQHIGTASFDNLNLTHKNGEAIAKSLESVGFKSEFPVDFSKDEFVELPIPRVAAIVKLYVPKIPTTKTDDIEGYLEYTDKDGNYFKKSIILNAQGSSSMGYYVKNMAVDFNDDSKVKFGHWVSQDSFHIKKYYIDAFRGQCVVGYHLMEQVYQTRPLGEKKPFDYLNANDSIYEGIGKIKKDFNTGALCHPDGFPIIVYHVNDGVETYMGVYAWCLKKHRDNYYADKSKATNIILDGTLYDEYIWNGNIDWTKFEIRNPKGLIDINGNEYDGENPKELSDTDGLSAETKGYIERLSTAKAALEDSMTKSVFEQYFLVKPFIDWYLVSQVTYNIDGFGKNWIWCSWDGKLWTPTLYDVDSIFGSSSIGTFIEPKSSNSIINLSISSYLSSLYAEEIKLRYIELRDKKVFDEDNIINLLENWIGRIGYQNLKDDLELYNETPSYRDSHLNENWEIISYTWDLNNDSYNNSTMYNIGDECIYYGYKFRAKSSVVGVAPLNHVYNRNPYGMGMYNSPMRVYNWLKNRISYLDGIYNYSV